MENINPDFNIPFYIVEELITYIELNALGYSESKRWDTIKALLRVAKVNGRFSKEQIDFLESKYCRENGQKAIDSTYDVLKHEIHNWLSER